MRIGLTTNRPKEDGFSLIELLIVVAIIVIMAAVALPNIGQYIRNYRIRGAAQQVAGEIQSARTKAIMGNTNNGVSFVIIDSDTYRFIREDAVNATDEDRFGPLRDLPMGVTFVAGPDPSFRFGRLGSWCKPGVAGCAPTPGTLYQTPPAPVNETPRCTQAPGLYMTVDPVAGVSITLRETQTGLQRTVVVNPGGRVRPVQ